MSDPKVISSDCVACLSVELGGDSAIATIALLRTLETVPREQVLLDLCFVHAKQLAQAREPA